MLPESLPVYQQKDRILDALAEHRVVVVESPTGSGKTTQLPVILYEAGYGRSGIIGITQPRRIAAVSVSAFVARQVGSTMPGLVGYKMRFDDHTTEETRIKIMTDGILLQETKADQLLRDYSVIMVDEAHERSLNIDFVLGLLKRALELRSELRVIVSSATINASVFSRYFDACPIVRIETEMFPVQVIYDDPFSTPETAVAEQDSINRRAVDRGRRGGSRSGALRAGEKREGAYDVRLDRVVRVIKRVLEEQFPGDILVFLSGEQMIKDCITRLYSLPERDQLYIMPLYGRLSKEEQDAVFPPAPPDRTKVVVATNIAETSITIDGITVVIDSGLAKTNYYNPRTYTSALIEGPISKAGAEQRKGRAGRTRPGRCYRLYGRREFDDRPLFQEDEIYRTDLSEVVLRMAELGIRDFEDFDFISSPGRGNILGAVEILRLLDALNDERQLTTVGQEMAVFPLLPRHSRIIVEAIHNYPGVLEEILIAVSFLTSATPFVLPPGEEIEARRAHHMYRDNLGDFVSYLRLFDAYTSSQNREVFCESRYLDPRTMAEIANVKQQLEEIVSDMGIPVSSGGSRADYLTAISRGLIQFVCVHTGKGVYRSLTAERIQIHPGSGLFRETPQFIVAGEIVKTSRTYARSVSPLKKEWLQAVSAELYRELRRTGEGKPHDRKRSRTDEKERERRDTTWKIRIGGTELTLQPYKGKKKIATIPYEDLMRICADRIPEVSRNVANTRARVECGAYTMMAGERLATVLRAGYYLHSPLQILEEWPRKESYTMPENADELLRHLDDLLRPVPLKKKTKQLGFLTVYSSREGRYWFKPNRSFVNAVQESLATLEQLVDELSDQEPSAFPETIGPMYRYLNEIIDRQS